MFCSRCGKKVMDDMLFCPFCGTKLIIPRQDETSVNGIQTGQGALNRHAEETSSHETFEPFLRDLSGNSDRLAEDLTDIDADFRSSDDEEARSVSDTIETEDDFFTPAREQPQENAETDTFAEFERAHVPLPSDGDENKLPTMDRVGDWSEYLDDKTSESVDESKADASSTIEPFQRAPRAQTEGSWNESGIEPFQRASRSDRSTQNQSGVPNDMFMDDEDDYDSFDEEDEEPNRGRRGAHHSRDDEDDDDLPNSFFMRHIRGIVGLLLFLMLLVIVALYALSDQGQTQLARINATLPLNPKVYARLGREYYDAEDYTQSSLYFERALAREPRNYDYAQSAVMAYLADENVDKAVEMLKRCININPKAIEPYLYLQNLYPDENTRPWEIAQLIQKGYEQTGDERLSID